MDNIKVTKAQLELCFERFIHDARNDFFPDPIGYYDLRLVRDELITKLTKSIKLYLQQTKTSNYEKELCYDWDVPKSNFVVRQGLVMHPRDRLYYHFILSRLIPIIEPRLSKRKYSHVVTKTKAKKLFERPVNDWIKYKNDIKNFFETNQDYQYLVSTDIAGYYEYIHIRDFKKQISQLTNNKENQVIEMLNSFLKSFSLSTNKDSGIPQNYDPSAYLCSSFLDFLDKELESKGYIHFRFVDDIKIPCKTKIDAKSAIIDVIRILRNMNLNVSTAKTEIWEIGDDDYKKFTDEFHPVIENIMTSFKKKRRSQIEVQLPELINLTKNVMRDRKNFNDRLFRACIWRIVKAHYFKNIVIYNLDGIGKSCIKFMEDMPERTEMFLNFLVLHKNRKYVHDGLYKILLNCVYPWQEMLIWGLLVKSSKIKNDEIVSLAKKRLREHNERDPALNYIILFLGKHGDYQDKHLIASLISQTHSFLTKRCILLAIQEYQDRNIIYNNIKKSTDDIILVSLVKYIKQLSKPKYIDDKDDIGSDLAFPS